MWWPAVGTRYRSEEIALNVVAACLDDSAGYVVPGAPKFCMVWNVIQNAVQFGPRAVSVESVPGMKTQARVEVRG